MNMLAALRDTIDIAVERTDIESPEYRGDLEPPNSGEPCSIDHFETMYEAVKQNPSVFSDAKLGRWLGWVQGVLCGRSLVTLDEMKEINKKYSD